MSTKYELLLTEKCLIFAIKPLNWMGGQRWTTESAGESASERTINLIKHLETLSPTVNSQLVVEWIVNWLHLSDHRN